MTEGVQVDSLPAAPDIGSVLKKNYLALAKLLVGRLAVVAVLVAVPIIIDRAGGPDNFFTALPFALAAFVFVLTLYRILWGVRITQCARVLRHFPLEFRDRVEQKKREWGVQGNIYTLRLSTRGRQGEPTMWALNAAGVRRWPQGAEKGVWFAGDPAFGGVMVVPGSNAMMFMNPADWEKHRRKRENADADTVEKARLAKIDKRNWKKPKFWRGG